MRLNQYCLNRFPALIVIAVLWMGACSAKAPSAGTKAPSVQQWQVIGPGGGGGIFLPTISPFDPNIMMVHCDMTAAYITYDGGENWRMFNIWTVPSDFEFDPLDPNTIYAANRGSLHDEDRGSGLGLLYRSEDQGKRWRVIYPDITKAKPVEKLQSQDLLPSQIIEGAVDGTIQKICVDPQDNRKIYLGLAPLVGATVVTSKTWERIGEADRAALIEGARALERKLRVEVPALDREAVVEMKKRGLVVTRPAEGDEGWAREAEKLSRKMRDELVAGEIFDRAIRVREEYRTAPADGDGN